MGWNELYTVEASYIPSAGQQADAQLLPHPGTAYSRLLVQHKGLRYSTVQVLIRKTNARQAVASQAAGTTVGVGLQSASPRGWNATWRGVNSM